MIRLISLGDFLSRSKDFVQINPTEKYKQVKVRLWGKGVTLRNEVNGLEVKAQRRVRVKSSQFIVSKIDARNGAFGLISGSLEGAIVSSDFPVYDIDASVIVPRYLEWLSKSRQFVRMCAATSEGTTNRVRLREHRFLNLKIPLPPLDEQRRIVAKLNSILSKLEEARRLRDEMVEKTRNIVESKLNQIFSKTKDEGWKKTELGNICQTSSGGTPSRAHAENFVGYIPWVKSGELNDSIVTTTAESISEDAIRNSSAKLLPKGTLLMALYGATTGKLGILGMNAATNQAVCALFPDESVLNKTFLWWFLLKMRPIYLSNSFGGAQPNISQKVVRNTLIPTPSLGVQIKIVQKLEKFKTRIDNLQFHQSTTEKELGNLESAILAKAFRGEL